MCLKGIWHFMVLPAAGEGALMMVVSSPHPIRTGLRTWGPTIGLVAVLGWAGSRAVLAYARILLEERERVSR